jgi:AcrR family transcriptional regulator
MNSKAQTHDRIVKAAHELFTKIGFDATKTEMIAERAGVSRQTLYEYYKTKEDLYSASLKIEAENFDRIINQIDPRAHPAVIITSIIHAMFDEFLATAKFTILDVKLHERINLPKVVVEMGADHQYQIQNALRRGIEAGIFRHDADASIFQATIIMVLTGFTFSNEVVDSLTGIDCSTEAAVAAWKDRLTDLLLRSITRTSEPG